MRKHISISFFLLMTGPFTKDKILGTYGPVIRKKETGNVVLAHSALILYWPAIQIQRLKRNKWWPVNQRIMREAPVTFLFLVPPVLYLCAGGTSLAWWPEKGKWKVSGHAKRLNANAWAAFRFQTLSSALRVHNHGPT